MPNIRDEEVNRIISDTSISFKENNYTRVIELIEVLLKNYSDLVNLANLQEMRAVSLLKVGRFSEAQHILKGFLEEHKKLGMPISSTTWMHNWLVCYYKGNSSEAMNQFVQLDEEKAASLIALFSE